MISTARIVGGTVHYLQALTAELGNHMGLEMMMV
jgi:hypothetical protein